MRDWRDFDDGLRDRFCFSAAILLNDEVTTFFGQIARYMSTFACIVILLLSGNSGLGLEKEGKMVMCVFY